MLFFCSLSADENGGVDLEDVLILFMSKMMTFPIYNKLSGGKNSDEDVVKEYAGFVGKKCAKKLLLFRK